MVKVFVSQPMRGRDAAEIEAERDYIMTWLSESRGEKCREIPSFFGPKADKQMKPLECLGKSLELMSHADIVVFARGWQDARGCRIEHERAVAYGYEVVHFDELDAS